MVYGNYKVTLMVYVTQLRNYRGIASLCKNERTGQGKARNLWESIPSKILP